MHTLIFSPHRGTAALSLPVALSVWLSRGHRVTLVTVFSRSLEAPFSDADTVHANDRLTYVSAMRRKEDEQLQRLHPKLQMLELNLKDAVIRHRVTAEEAFRLPASPTDTAVEKIQKTLAKLAGQQASPIEAIVLPLGVGEHLDHRVVRDAVLTAEARASLPVAFYEDQPYASQTAGFDAVETLTDFAGFDASELKPLRIHSDDALAARARTLALYGSQIDEQFAAGITAYTATHQGSDRLWVSSDWPGR